MKSVHKPSGIKKELLHYVTKLPGRDIIKLKYRHYSYIMSNYITNKLYQRMQWACQPEKDSCVLRAYLFGFSGSLL